MSNKCCRPQAMTSTEFLAELVRLRKDIADFEADGGIRGYSAYQVAVNEGFTGTVEEWLLSLVGPEGEQGIPGPVGPIGPEGDITLELEALRQNVQTNKDIVDIKEQSAVNSANSAATSANNAHISELNANTSAGIASNGAIDAQNSMLGAAQSAQSALVSKTNAKISETNAALYAQRADLALIPKGYYNPVTNTSIDGALTDTPNPAFPNGAFYEVDVEGASQIDGANFNIGDTLHIGDRIEKIGAQWSLKPNPTTNYALNLDTQEKLKVIAHIEAETITASNQNGGSVDVVAQTITVPNTTSGNTSHIAYSFTTKNQYDWNVGDTLYLEVVVTENIANISNIGGQQLKFNLNVNRLVSGTPTLIPDVAIETGFQRLNPTQVLLWFNYVITADDIEIISFLQKAFPGATNNSGGFWRWTVNQVNYHITKSTETLQPISAKLNDLSAEVYENKLYTSLINYPILTVLAAGGLVFKNDSRIVIPNGTNSYNTYFWRLIPLTDLPGYKVGNKIKVVFVITESVPGSLTAVSPNRVTANIWMRRIGDLINNVVESSDIERFDANTVRVTLTTTITADDIELRLGLIVSSTVLNNTGTDLGFTLTSVNALNLEEISHVTNNTDTFNKLVENVDINAQNIINSELALSATNNTLDGSPSGGATYSLNKLTIPIGQSGLSSFVVLRFPINTSPVFNDMIGKVVTFEYIAKTSANLFDQRSLHLQANATTGGVVIGDSAVNPQVIYVDSTHIKLRFTYLVKFNDTRLDTYVQFNDTLVAVGSAQTIELQNKIYYSWQDPNQKNPNVSVLESNSKILTSELTSVANSNILLPLVVTSGGSAGDPGTTLDFDADTITIASGTNPGYSYLFKRNATVDHSDWVPGKEIKYYLIIGENQPGVSDNPAYENKYKLRATLNSVISGAYAERLSTYVFERLDASTVMYTITRVVEANETSVDIILSTYGYINATGSNIVFTWKGLHYKMSTPREAINPNSQVIYDISRKVNALESGGDVTYVKIAKTGGDYTNIPDALAAIVDASASKKYVLVQYPGIYEEYEWKLEQYISLIGVDRDTCINQLYNPVNANDTQISQSSNFWTLGNNNVGNVTFRCRNNRYNLHDDQPGTEDSTNRFWNVNFIHEGNQSAIDWRNSPDNTLGYLPGNVWQNVIPIGKGNRSGSKTYWENCTFSALQTCFGLHNQVNFEEGAYETFKNCEFKSGKDFAWLILLQSYGAGRKCIWDGSDIKTTFGYAYALSDTTWFSNLPENQTSNHTEWEVSLPRYVSWVDTSVAYGLKITSNKIVGSSIVSVSGSAVADIFGSPVERHLGWGMKGYVYGSWDIHPGINGGNNVLGKRLGNASKTLVVTIDGVDFTVNFSNSALLTNDTIIANINAVLGSAGSAGTHIVGFQEYYPSIYGEFIGRNKDTITIPRFTAVKRGSSANSILAMTSADNANLLIGFTLENVIPGSTARCSKEAVFGRYQLNGLGGTGTGPYGSNITLTANVGEYAIGTACVVGRSVDIEFAFMQAPENRYF